MNELNIAKTLSAKRKEKGITQDELASYIGVSKASVSKWETGQSYPDITFLPQLAAYFNISVDELIDYKPQMIDADIRRLYLRLSKDFSEKQFEIVINEVREIVKKYYSCFPLLNIIGILMLNHHTLAMEEQRLSIIREAQEIFIRVKIESNDKLLCRKANMMEATCCLLLSEYEKLIELLDGSERVSLNETTILSIGYSLIGNTDKANEILQIGAYQDLLSILEKLMALLSLLQYDLKNEETVDKIIKRLLILSELFEVENLHTAVMLSIYVSIAMVYAVRNDIENTLTILEKYCMIATRASYPLILHGDEFFTKIETWLSELEIGTSAPIGSKAVKQSIVDVIATNPVFASLADNFRYQIVIKKLKSILGE